MISVGRDITSLHESGKLSESINFDRFSIFNIGDYITAKSTDALKVLGVRPVLIYK